MILKKNYLTSSKLRMIQQASLSRHGMNTFTVVSSGFMARIGRAMFSSPTQLAQTTHYLSSTTPSAWRTRGEIPSGTSISQRIYQTLYWGDKLLQTQKKPTTTFFEPMVFTKDTASRDSNGETSRTIGLRVRLLQGAPTSTLQPTPPQGKAQTSRCHSRLVLYQPSDPFLSNKVFFIK